ncbi:DinB family protein [Puia sp. P3]|uniref:DinB family protein n=1 Tax=Puia sp. P3 TaxID=3423952 RepID=UPI003D66F491
MKKLLLCATVLVALLTTSFRLALGLAPGTMSPDERKFALDYYQKTKARLLKDLKGLSEAQMNFRADTGRWSVYECTEHIALSENMMWEWVQMAQKQAAAPEKRGEVKVTTDQLMKMMTDRSHKVKTMPPLEPEKKFPDTKAALDAFTSRRDSTIYYIRSTQDDLRNHFVQAPFGTIDAYQALIMLAAHSERHTLQIEEVPADPNFPKQ